MAVANLNKIHDLYLCICIFMCLCMLGDQLCIVLSCIGKTCIVFQLYCNALALIVQVMLYCNHNVLYCIVVCYVMVCCAVSFCFLCFNSTVLYCSVLHCTVLCEWVETCMFG